MTIMLHAGGRVTCHAGLWDSGAAAATLYDAFGADPNSAGAANAYNALRAVAEALRGRGPAARVIELGCGRGARTKAIAGLPGVARVLGVDSSPEQLALALSGPQPRNCRFMIGDIVALGQGQPDWQQGAAATGGSGLDLGPELGTYDVALLEFVTSHAAGQEELNAMVAAAAAFLRPGGEVVVLEGHPRLDRAPFPDSTKYGLAKEFLLPPCQRAGPVLNFTALRTTFLTAAGALSVDAFFHGPRAWAAAAGAARLTGLTIEDAEAPPHPVEGFWDDYCCSTAVIRATRA